MLDLTITITELNMQNNEVIWQQYSTDVWNMCCICLWLLMKPVCFYDMHLSLQVHSDWLKLMTVHISTSSALICVCAQSSMCVCWELKLISNSPDLIICVILWLNKETHSALAEREKRRGDWPAVSLDTKTHTHTHTHTLTAAGFAHS